MYLLDKHRARIHIWFTQLLFSTMFLTRILLFGHLRKLNKIGFYARRTIKEKNHTTSTWLLALKPINCQFKTWCFLNVLIFFFFQYQGTKVSENGSTINMKSIKQHSNCLLHVSKHSCSSNFRKKQSHLFEALQNPSSCTTG